MQQSSFNRQIVIATKNRGKTREIKDFFKDIKDLKWLTSDDFDFFPDIREGDRSFLENAKTKARVISEITGLTTLADDSGLVVDILDGAPGVISSRYAGRVASDRDNRQKLLLEMSEVKLPEQRKARFVCNMVMWDPELGMIANTIGTCEGRIAFEEKGTGGFGYDCIFVPSGYKKTMAELSQDEKNRISHRGRALNELKSFLKEYLDSTDR
jgi:XTP/dITP diphosphohydrolase